MIPIVLGIGVTAGGMQWLRLTQRLPMSDLGFFLAYAAMMAAFISAGNMTVARWTKHERWRLLRLAHRPLCPRCLYPVDRKSNPERCPECGRVWRFRHAFEE